MPDRKLSKTEEYQIGVQSFALDTITMDISPPSLYDAAFLELLGQFEGVENALIFFARSLIKAGIFTREELISSLEERNIPRALLDRYHHLEGGPC